MSVEEVVEGLADRVERDEGWDRQVRDQRKKQSVIPTEGHEDAETLLRVS